MVAHFIVCHHVFIQTFWNFLLGLDKPQVPVYKSIFVTGISDNTTHDAIMLCFESPRNGGGPVENVYFEPSSGCAVVVFQDRGGM